MTVIDTWHPTATRDEVFPGSGPYLGGPWRGCLHTTEGSSYAGARGAYSVTHNGPHFTASCETGAFQVWQHLPLDVAATALVHPASSPVQTNRLSCVQIEIVGSAAVSPTWTGVLLEGLRDLMTWIETQTGILAQAPPFKPYPASGGANNGVRMPPAAWARFSGWCGHQHVPFNDHGDPGAPDLATLLRRTTAPAPPPGPVPSTVYDYEEGAVKTMLMHIGPLDGQGNGWADWQPGLGRDPIVVGLTLLGPSPPDDGGYWPGQAHVILAAQPRGGSLRVVVRGGTPSDTVSVWATVS